jgi:hypothetical protein
MSAHNLMTLFKRTSLNVYDADIFNCSRQPSPSSAIRGVEVSKVGRFLLKVGTTFRGSMAGVGDVRAV